MKDTFKKITLLTFVFFIVFTLIYVFNTVGYRYAGIKEFRDLEIRIDMLESKIKGLK